MKDKIISILRSTNVAGMDNVIKWLEESDFFIAPASTNFHGNYPGGLAEHSLNVYNIAMALKKTMSQFDNCADQMEQISDESIAIAALLHDICKANLYKPTQKKRQNAMGVWVPYDTYTVNYGELPVGHGEKSVIILLREGLDMTDDEILAIRWHMTAWDLPFQSADAKSNLNEAKANCPLLTLIQTADGLASALLEETK